MIIIEEMEPMFTIDYKNYLQPEQLLQLIDEFNCSNHWLPIPFSCLLLR